MRRLGEFYRSRKLSWRLEALSRRARLRAKTARLKVRRAAFEAGAVARSSATISGISTDARRAAHKVRASTSRAAAASAADNASHRVARVRSEWRTTLDGTADQWERAVGAFAMGARARAARMRSAALRSRTVSGIAIDSHRAAKRLRSMRNDRKGRAAQ